MASRKTTVIDLLNEYLAKGQMPPKELLEQVAESEALKAPPPALDPIQLLAGSAAFGPLAEAANESVGAGLGYTVPKLLKMAPTPQSGLAMPIGGRATSDLAPPKTGKLTGVELPGGGIANWGTHSMPGAKFPNEEKGSSFQTSPINGEDKWEMILGHHGEDDTSLPDREDLFNLLIGEPKGKVTAPLPPQGATGQFGNQASPAKHLVGDSSDFWNGSFANKTEPLTPFEAHEQAMLKLPLENSEKGMTGDLPGEVTHFAQGGPGSQTVGNVTTKPLNIDNRTASLEPADIEEMAGRETPPTEDLLAALAQNLSPKDTRPLPENTIYHGLNVFGQRSRKETLANISEQGMKGGWFSEEPHATFGPHFIATRPEDLPPLLIRSRQFGIDPEKEIIPRWKQMNTENLETAMRLRGKAPAATLTPDTVKGRPAMRSSWPNIHQLVGADEGGGGFPLEKGGHVVPPEKLFLSNKAGDILGRLAPKGGKPNALNSIMDRARSFRNVLEKGAGKATNSIDSVFHKLWGDDPELKGASKATKIAKLKIFVAQPEPENPTLAKIWKPFMDAAKEALLTVGEDIPK